MKINNIFANKMMYLIFRLFTLVGNTRYRCSMRSILNTGTRRSAEENSRRLNSETCNFNNKYTFHGLNATTETGVILKNALSNTSLYNIVDRKIIFEKGKHQTSKDIIIPAGYSVEFKAGHELDLIDSAKFIVAITCIPINSSINQAANRSTSNN